MKRTLAFLVAVISAAALLSGCGSAADPAAAKVGSESVSRKTLDDELRTLSENTEWLRAIASNVGVTEIALPNGGVSTKFSTAWLTTLVNQMVVDQIFDARDLKVTAKDRDAAEAQARALFTVENGSTFGTFPKSFRDAYLKRQSRFEAVQATLPVPTVTDQLLAETLEQAKATYCATGNAVSHILVKTQAEADLVATALAAGTDFATVAADSSTDTGTARVGGFLTCTGSPNYAQLPESIRAVVDATPVGTTSAPVQTEFGFTIVRVTPFDVANLRALADTLYQQSRPNPMLRLITARLVKAKVWVDPRYGRVKRGGGAVVIQPPVAPDPRNNPKLTPSTTTPAAATGQ